MCEQDTCESGVLWTMDQTQMKSLNMTGVTLTGEVLDVDNSPCCEEPRRSRHGGQLLSANVKEILLADSDKARFWWES